MAALGSLVVSLAMDIAKFSGDVGKAAQQMARLTAEAGKIGAALGAAAAAGTRAMIGVVKASVDAAVAVGQLSQLSGVSAEEFSKLAVGARAAGISQEKLADVYKDTQDKLVDFLQNGAGPLKDFFDNIAPRVGVTAQQFRNLSGPQALGLYVKSLEQANLTQAEMVFYMEALASDSALLLPLLRDGASGFAQYSAQAEKLGAVISGDVVAQSMQMRDAFVMVDLAKQGLANRITRELLPAMTGITQRLLESAEASVMLDRAARVASFGVKLLSSIGAVIVGVFDTLGSYLGGVAAQLVALFSGRFKEAFNIGENVTRDFIGNIQRYAGTVSTIWDESAASVESKAPMIGQRLASPVVNAAKTAAKAAKQIKTEAEKAYEAIEKRLDTLQFEVDTQGASDRIKGLIELTRQGAKQEHIDRYLRLTEAQEAFRKNAEEVARTERDKQEIIMEGAAIYESTRTPLERLVREHERLNDMLRIGALNQETFDRAALASKQRYAETQESVKETGDAVSTFVQKARENIQDSLGDTLFNAMNGNFKNIGDAFVRMLQRMVAEALAAQLVEAMFGSKQQSGTGGGGVFGPMLSTLGNALFGGKAYGGPVSAGRAVPVGEHGPEVFVPTTSGTIIPQNQMGRTLNLTVNVNASPGMSQQTALQQGQQIGRGIQIALARNG